jgi:hypothetical protein
VVTAPFVILGAATNGSTTVSCAAGDVAISGGVQSPDGQNLNVRSSRPDPIDATTNPTGWFIDVRGNPIGGDQNLTAYVLCVTP